MNPIFKQSANTLTILNLCMGVFSIFSTIKGNFELSLLLIFSGGIADMFDGMVARKLHITSEIGKFLDSNSDLITFGLAPALLVYFSVLHEYDLAGLFIVVIFVICSSIRLAKYNMVVFDGYYRGLPTTFAGPALALSILLRSYIPAYAFMVITLLLGYVMVANFKVKKFH